MGGRERRAGRARNSRPPRPHTTRACKGRAKAPECAGVTARSCGPHVTQRIMTKGEKPLFRFLASPPAPDRGGHVTGRRPGPFKGAAASGDCATLYGASRSGSRCGCHALSCRSPARGFRSAVRGRGALPVDQRGPGGHLDRLWEGQNRRGASWAGGWGGSARDALPFTALRAGSSVRWLWRQRIDLRRRQPGFPFPSKTAPRGLRGALGRRDALAEVSALCLPPSRPPSIPSLPVGERCKPSWQPDTRVQNLLRSASLHRPAALAVGNLGLHCLGG